MNISEIRVKLVPNDAERLKAFCSITLDEDFVIRDLKVIDGANGLFVAMPSRKLCDRCPKCGCKNHLRARHCNDCGAQLSEARASRDEQGRAKLHADIAHPINAACRERLQKAVVEAFRMEVEKSRQPGYQPPSLDEEEEVVVEVDDQVTQQAPSPPPQEEAEEQAQGDNDDYASLIAGLKQDAKSRRKNRRGRDREFVPQDSAEETAKPPTQPASEPSDQDAGAGLDPLDSFLSKLGTGSPAGKSSRRRRSGRQDSGPRRQDQDGSQPQPPATKEPERPAEPIAEPEPVPAAQPQASEPEEYDDDDFGAGIL
jgi:stage V sporulation protein G